MNFHNTDALDAVEPRLPVVPEDTDVDTRLGKIARRIQVLQTRITKAHLEIAELVDAEAARLPERRMKRFLSAECGISSSEAKTYLSVRSSLLVDGAAETVVEHRLSFGVIRALAAADPSTRETALSRLAAGAPIYESSIGRIRRQLTEQNLDAEAKREIARRKALDAASRSLAARRIETFKGDFLPFARTLLDFYQGEMPDGVNMTFASWLEETAQYLKTAAAACVARFVDTFDTANLPAPWLYDFHGVPDEAVSLARALDALRDLMEGRFQDWDEEYNRPQDPEHDYLDRRIVESVVWLFEEVELPRRKAILPPTQRSHLLGEPSVRLASLEICAGAGGQAIGLHAAGFDAIGIYERDKSAVRTLNRNYPLGPVHQADVSAIDFRKYLGRVDLVAGGVPCQGHSSIGHQKGREDHRDLFLEAVRVVKEVQPRAFFFENVQGFNFTKNAAYRAELYDLFAGMGYDSKVFSFYAHDYGLAQARPRVAFIGFRDGVLDQFRMPPVLTPTPVSVGTALHDLVAANGWKGAAKWAETTAKIVSHRVV
ncbi:DNA (cytosine-5-)-methyltransferase [Aquibium carbonis]|uniref:DNA (cytosine-5-)-methyltransferase n=1 Tax=Aquibium carbonis TaxID=2495581 RepID=A0A3R9YCT6_9HYPH|nr:DNA (cytosine-5-)-methyltransferase [Aquibium carbonis]RST84689.1 DNA (cytosine-5-)-methyltransferase [Aquibium carbonis]